MSRYDDLSEKARYYVQNWDEIDLAEMLASRDATPTVQGYCPACRGQSLMLGEGGYVTCRRDNCPDREAATRLLEQRIDYSKIREIGIGPETVTSLVAAPVPAALRGREWKARP